MLLILSADTWNQPYLLSPTSLAIFSGSNGASPLPHWSYDISPRAMSSSSTVSPFHDHDDLLSSFALEPSALDEPVSSSGFEPTTSFSPLSCFDQDTPLHSSQHDLSPSQLEDSRRQRTGGSTEPGAFAGLDMDEEMRKFIESLPTSEQSLLDEGEGAHATDAIASLLANIGSPPNRMFGSVLAPFNVNHCLWPMESSSSH
jgi:hypothetical protein